MDSVNWDIIHKGLPHVLIVYVQPQKGSVSPPGIFHLLGKKIFSFFVFIWSSFITMEMMLVCCLPDKIIIL